MSGSVRDLVFVCVFHGYLMYTMNNKGTRAGRQLHRSQTEMRSAHGGHREGTRGQRKQHMKDVFLSRSDSALFSIRAVARTQIVSLLLACRQLLCTPGMTAHNFPGPRFHFFCVITVIDYALE